MSDVETVPVEWLVPDLLPKGFLTVLIGEEGIGKGLFCAYLSGLLTGNENPRNVMVIAGEDDPYRVIRPRLEAVGADLDRVQLLLEDAEKGVGLPALPEDIRHIEDAVISNQIHLLIIDPWLSAVSDKLAVKDTQQARRFLDPLAAVARRTGACVLLVGHTNRGDSPSARNRYGSTVGIRQAARHCLMAMPDPSDPECLLVGPEKSNLAAMAAAKRYRKFSDETSLWLEETSVQPESTIREHVEAALQVLSTDRRQSDRWDLINEVLTECGLVSRAEVVEIYIETGSTEKAADKALSRWTSGPTPLLYSPQKGSYVFSQALPGEGAVPPIPTPEQET